MSSYSCRNAYGRAHGRVSEHGKANAVDIGSFVTARGQAALVVADWGPTARQIAAEAAAAGKAAAETAQASAPTQPSHAGAEPTSVRGKAAGQQARSVAGPAAVSAQPVLPLDLRPGMTIGIPGITLDMPGSSDRSPSSFGLMAPSRLGGPKPPPKLPPAVHRAGRQDGFPARRPPLGLQACSTPCSAPRPTTPTSTISTSTWPSASRTSRFASEFASGRSGSPCASTNRWISMSGHSAKPRKNVTHPATATACLKASIPML